MIGLKNQSVWIPLLIAIAKLLDRCAITACNILCVHCYREYPAVTIAGALN
jgi:hypothetical protein